MRCALRGGENRRQRPHSGARARHYHCRHSCLLSCQELLYRVPEADFSAQTEAEQDRPSTPIFVPESSGDDAATQILPGELFDFDTEVQPILDALVGA